MSVVLWISFQARRREEGENGRASVEGGSWCQVCMLWRAFDVTQQLAVAAPCQSAPRRGRRAGVKAWLHVKWALLMLIAVIYQWHYHTALSHALWRCRVHAMHCGACLTPSLASTARMLFFN
jgi:hypothetical protein